MTQNAVSVQMDASLQEIGEIFKNNRFHHLPVLDGKKLVGVLSDKDYLKAVSPYIGKASEDQSARQSLFQRAHQIMSRNVITQPMGTSIENAASILLEKSVSCLLIVTADGDLAGLVTWKDILKFYLRKMWCENPLVDLD